MKSTTEQLPWQILANQLSGELHWDETHRMLFATDASVYREVPLAVAFPRAEQDLVACVRFAVKYGVSITPRAGGTSLAGQAVGSGLIVDVSRFMRSIIEINPTEGYAIVEPGVIRDQLNAALAPLGYWFGPNTSTANRCTLGGMFGNNSCGSTSITVGSTREHVLEARVVLADGSLMTYGARTQGAETGTKGQGEATDALAAKIETHLHELLTNSDNRKKIMAAFPRREVSRRNTGYALDLLAEQHPFTPGGPPFNLCTLLAGSEGTLALTSQLKVNILPLPPEGSAVVALHYRTVNAAMRETQRVMRSTPFMCELMDDTILRLARTNPEQARNSAFVDGDPRALLLVEFRAESDATAAALADAIIEPEGTAYAAPIITGKVAVAKVWKLRAAGLGILGNIVGDAKAVACIEDTAVAIEDLADYIAEVSDLLALYQQNPVYYAHAGAGEIHLRPILNLKTAEGRDNFFNITRDVAALVKKYRGSLSGEHGDGRVRAAFLPDMLGSEVYQILVELKRIFDPVGVFNPGKIVEAPPMNEGLRYAAGQASPEYQTTLDFSGQGGLLRTAEKCNGSGDCRKLSGGAMCPSYRATLSEQHSTRGRANLLREVLTQTAVGSTRSGTSPKEDPFAHPALEEALDLCLSCKACTSECPSSVDMTNLKAEYLHQRGKISLRTRLVAANEELYALGSKLPGVANLGLRVFGPLLKKVTGIAQERSLPNFTKETLRTWFRRNAAELKQPKSVIFFGDEFTNLQDVTTGKAAITLLRKLGYHISWPPHAASGRAQLSKGLLNAARKRAAANVVTFAALVSAEQPLVGLEPSAVLGFRDEYPKLLRGAAAEQARELAQHVYTLDEFLHRELEAGRIGPDDFGTNALNVVLHVHCHEKALGDARKCASALSLPPNFNVTLLDSGCCGMAGSFGYEAEHFELSKQIAEQSLLRYLRGLPAATVVVANGTSCRHQVKDLLGKQALSTGEVLLRSF